MKPPKREPGAATGAGSAEVRKASGGAGSGAAGKCGKSAEEVRNLSISPVLTGPAALPTPPAAVPAPGLVRVSGRKQREGSPAPAPVSARARRCAEADKLNAIACVVDRAGRDLKDLCASAGDYRREALDAASVGLCMLLALADGAFDKVRGGYRLAPELRGLVLEHAQAIRAAFLEGRVVFEAERRRVDLEAVMAPARELDPPFVRMLEGLTRGGALPD